MDNKQQNGVSVHQQQTQVQNFSFFNPDQFATMQRVATVFANSELVPDMYKVSDKNPKEKAIANCVIACDLANRIGANILMVMQNLIIIYGRPSWSSKFLVATVNTCGRFEPLKYKVRNLGELKNFKYTEYETSYGPSGKQSKLVDKILAGPVENLEYTAYTKMIGSDDVLEGPPISIEMALKEGWYTKKGSKWPNMPKLMLMYRSASMWTNTYAPELSLGMKTEDEVRDIEDIEFETVESKVKTEIKQNANKTALSMDDTEPENNGTENNSAEESETAEESNQEPEAISNPEEVAGF